MKYCPRCEQEKPFDMFYKNKAKKDGYQGSCKECKKKIDNDQYATNPKRKAAINGRSERIRTHHRLLNEGLLDMQGKGASGFRPSSFRPKSERYVSSRDGIFQFRQV